jgi:penicillin-binding protein 2
MLQPPADPRAPATPQLALRVAIMGGIALALFAIIFFRLWYLQVLSGDKYLAQANDNRVRDIVVPAPRGNILDRNGTILVDNRVSVAAQIDVDELPKNTAERAALIRRLSRVVHVAPPKIELEIAQQHKALPYAPVTIKQDVPVSVRNYLFERQDEFPGVQVRSIYLRSYPRHELAAQLFGTVGEISPSDEKLERFRGVKQGTIVGKGGLEFTYDRYLRGRDGATRVQVDALGRPKGEGTEKLPQQGKQLQLSLDLDLEKAGQQAMSEAGAIPITDGVKNRGGAFVAIDPRNGEILAMGSYPSFDPNVFAKPLKAATFKKLNSEENGAPLIDRAIQSGYPTGSTLKALTSVAALQSGVITPSTPIDDPGSIRIADITFQNAGKTPHGTLTLSDAIKVSSDVFFYTLGARMNSLTDQPLQTWLRRFGLGRATGIDLPGEIDGLVPSPAWRDRLYQKKLTDRPWSIGDNVNLAVGQGDLQTTPLQLAVAYSALANDGKLVTPHLGLRVQDAAGRLLQQIQPGPTRHIAIDETARQTILEGLRRAAGSAGGTSADVFAGFPHTVYGKTGTAERAGQGDQSWYVCYAPDKQRPIVVAVTVEQGGFGAETAAPAARLILSQWFGVEAKLVIGTSQSR